MKKIVLIFLIFCTQQAVAQTTAFTSIDSLLQRGSYQLALEKLYKIEPVSFLSTSKIAKIYSQLDMVKKAIIYYKKALLIKENDLLKLQLAKEYQKLKLYKKSIEIYKDILIKQPHNYLLQYRLAKIYLQTKQPKKAIERFQFLIQNDSTNANYSYQMAVAYAMLGKRNQKIDAYLDAYKKDNQHLKAIYHLAKSYKKLFDKDSMLLFMEKGLIVNPNHVDLNKMKINFLYRKKQYTEAIKLLKKIDTIKSQDFYTKMMLGKSYYHLDSLDKAKKQFIIARNLDTDNFKSYTYLGHIALKEKELDLAKLFYRIATVRGAKKRDVEYYGLGMAYVAKEKPKEAIAMFKNAIQQNNKNYKALYQYAYFSDHYYKDKKIGYKLYKRFLDKFKNADTVMTKFVKRRIKEIKKMYFLKGEVID